MSTDKDQGDEASEAGSEQREAKASALTAEERAARRAARRRARAEAEGEDEERPRARQVEEEDPHQVFGGRILVAAAVLLATVVIPMSSLGNIFEPKDRSAPSSTVWKVGETANVAVTLITADYNLLSCASDKEIEGVHCQYKTEREMWPRDPNAPLDDNKKEVIQPYRTAVDNKLILLAGLWATPEVAMRLHSEPPTGVEKDKLARFLAECKVKFVGEASGVRLRWSPSGQWMNADAVPLVAVPISCKVGNPP